MTKFLLCGNDRTLIHSFFSAAEADENFEFLSTTENPQDIKLHVGLFRPDLFVYCAEEQTEADLLSLDSALDSIQAGGADIVLIGDENEREIVLSRFGAGKVRLTVPREIGFPNILSRIRSLRADGASDQPSGGRQDAALSGAETPAAASGGRTAPVTDAFSAAGESSGARPPEDEARLTDTAQPASGAPAAQSGGESSPAGGFPDPGAQASEPAAAQRPVMQRQSAPSDYDPDKRRILVVDDDITMLKTIKLYLQDQYTVAVAPSGRTALHFLKTATVDLILLDYMMPDLNGSQVLTNLRLTERTAGIPVIFLTGVSDRDKIKEILGMNVQGYILKPVDNARLHEIVQNTLEKYGRYNG